MFGIIDWENELLQGLRGFEYQQPTIPQNLQEADRWICASAMQKAIRRNQPDMALKAGFSLLQLKPEQLWSRIRIIVAEDIGAASMLLVGQVLWVVGKRVWREENGGEDKILAYLVTQMCASKKSRVATDLLILGNYHLDYRAKCEELVDYSDEALEDLIFNPDTHPVIKTIAAWYINGAHPRSTFHLRKREGSPARLKSVYRDMGYPEWIEDILRMSLGRGEGHGVSLGFAWQHQEENEPVDIINQVTNPSQYIGEWYSEAYDAHTRDGKQYYNQLLKRHPAIKAYLNQNFAGKNHNAIIGMVVFALEGYLMNNRVTYASEKTITDKAIESYVDVDCTGHIRKELFALVADNMSTLRILKNNL